MSERRNQLVSKAKDSTVDQADHDSALREIELIKLRGKYSQMVLYVTMKFCQTLNRSFRPTHLLHGCKEGILSTNPDRFCALLCHDCCQELVDPAICLPTDP